MRGAIFDRRRQPTLDSGEIRVMHAYLNMHHGACVPGSKSGRNDGNATNEPSVMKTLQRAASSGSVSIQTLRVTFRLDATAPKRKKEACMDVDTSCHAF